MVCWNLSTTLKRTILPTRAAKKKKQNKKKLKPDQNLAISVGRQCKYLPSYSSKENSCHICVFHWPLHDTFWLGINIWNPLLSVFWSPCNNQGLLMKRVEKHFKITALKLKPVEKYKKWRKSQSWINNNNRTWYQVCVWKAHYFPGNTLDRTWWIHCV